MLPAKPYTLDASTAADYSGTLISSVTLNRNATLTTLSGGTTYYLRVRPSGYAIETGIPNNWAILGSTCTLTAPGHQYLFLDWRDEHDLDCRNQLDSDRTSNG